MTIEELKTHAEALGYRLVENPVMEYDYIEDSDDVYYFLNNYGENLTDTEFKRLNLIGNNIEAMEYPFGHRNAKWDSLMDRALKWINKACQKYEIRQH
jgi:hypothetical protein